MKAVACLLSLSLSVSGIAYGKGKKKAAPKKEEAPQEEQYSVSYDEVDGPAPMNWSFGFGTRIYLDKLRAGFGAHARRYLWNRLSLKIDYYVSKYGPAKQDGKDWGGDPQKHLYDHYKNPVEFTEHDKDLGVGALVCILGNMAKDGGLLAGGMVHYYTMDGTLEGYGRYASTPHPGMATTGIVEYMIKMSHAVFFDFAAEAGHFIVNPKVTFHDMEFFDAPPEDSNSTDYAGDKTYETKGLYMSITAGASYSW